MKGMRNRGRLALLGAALLAALAGSAYLAAQNFDVDFGTTEVGKLVKKEVRVPAPPNFITITGAEITDGRDYFRLVGSRFDPQAVKS